MNITRTSSCSCVTCVNLCTDACLHVVWLYTYLSVTHIGATLYSFCERILSVVLHWNMGTSVYDCSGRVLVRRSRPLR